MWKPMDQAEYEACEPGENGDARLEILLTGSNVLADANSQVTLTAKVTQNNTDITNNLAASMFNWTRDSGDPVSDTSWANDSDHRGKKSITVEPSDLNGTTKFYCKMRPVEDHGEFFPAVEDGKLMLQHDTHTTGDGHVFEIGHLIVNGVEDTTSPEIYLNATVDNGTPYSLDYPDLLVDSTAIAGPMTAGMYVYTAAPTREIRFFYNADGLRTRKQTLLGGRIVETTDYILHGKLVTEMRRGSDILHFFYDAQSRPAMVDYNGKKYTYVHNLQGDIVAMVDSSGAKVVEYRYDAWGRDIGRTLTSDIGELNPFRYRGYVYDEETELYYLRSRYYDAGIGRFVCGDIIVFRFMRLDGGNVYAYCNNEPIMYEDKDGKLFEKIKHWFRETVIGGLIERYASGQLNETEKNLIKSHPFAAVSVDWARNTANKVTAGLFGKNWNSDNTRENAFKHCLWNALMSYKLGEDLAKQFGNAHEEGMMEYYPDSTKMDLHNNSVGYFIASYPPEQDELSKSALRKYALQYQPYYQTSDWKIYVIIDRALRALDNGQLYWID